MQSNLAPNEELEKMRKEYHDNGLDDTDVPSDGNPFVLFKKWLDEACAAKVTEPNGMCLATVQKDGRPDNRMVLLKHFDENGFVWYTNYDSKKGSDLAHNPFAALVFWWGDLERSVRIQGKVSMVPTEESDAYFQMRPRKAEIGAWASD